MKQHLTINKDNKGKISACLHVIRFVDRQAEEPLYVWYAPALNLYGYGDNEAEVKESFKIHLEEFIRYTVEEGTLEGELKRLGWKVNKDKSVQPPSIANLFNRPEVQEILSKHPKMKETPAPVFHGYTYA